MHFSARRLTALIAGVAVLLSGSTAALSLSLASAATAKTKPTASTSTPGTTTPAGSQTTTTTTTTTPTKTDAAADHAALSDYRSYLQALVAGSPAGGRTDDLFAASVKRRCALVLAPLASMPTSQVSSAALSDLGEEIGADLALKFLSEAGQPFAQLSSSLSGLSWTEPAPAEAIHGLLAAESAVLSLSPSGVCQDARALAAHPRQVPPGSTSFLAVYDSDSAALKQQFSQFLTVLSNDATARDDVLIAQINQLVSRFGVIETNYEHRDATAILASIGLSS